MQCLSALEALVTMTVEHLLSRSARSISTTLAAMAAWLPIVVARHYAPTSTQHVVADLRPLLSTERGAPRIRAKHINARSACRQATVHLLAMDRQLRCLLERAKATKVARAKAARVAINIDNLTRLHYQWCRYLKSHCMQHLCQRHELVQATFSPRICQ